MPGGDRTGPMGMGPRTGRGAGFCGGFAVPGFMNRVFGGGFGRGRGRGGRGGGGGRGWRNMFHATGLTGWQRAAMNVPDAAAAAPQTQPPSPQEEIEMLKAQADAAAATLDRVRQRIDEIAAQSAAPSSNQ